MAARGNSVANREEPHARSVRAAAASLHRCTCYKRRLGSARFISHAADIVVTAELIMDSSSCATASAWTLCDSRKRTLASTMPAHAPRSCAASGEGSDRQSCA